MKANDAVRLIMKSKNITQGELTKLLKLSSQSGVSQVLNRDMRASTLVRFLMTMNCELIIRDGDTGQVYEISE